ncbi:MAG: hypothetical protein ACI361_04425 [Atopobiaceae bacterium]
MSGGVKESDWKLFRKLLPQWQEQAMERLCREYQEILADSSKPVSERFWKLDERIRKDRRMACVIAPMKRSAMYDVLHELMYEHAITLDDLDGMSEKLQERMKGWAEIMLE